DARAVVAHRFHQRPARRLDDAALDLVDDAVRVDDLPGIDRRDRARDAHLAARAIDFDVGDHRHVAGEILVLGEREAATARAVPLRVRPPTGALRRGLDRGARARRLTPPAAPGRLLCGWLQTSWVQSTTFP